jgi:hypothetical protein
MAIYPDIRAGQRMTADVLRSMLPLTVTKATTESVTSSTVLQDDDELFLPVEANATYLMYMFLLHDSDATVAGDIKIGFSSPASSVWAWGVHGANTAATSNSAVTSVNMSLQTTSSTVSFGGGDSAGTTAWVSGTLVTDGTAGNLTLQWAQDTSNAVASRVRQGSYMTLIRTA